MSNHLPLIFLWLVVFFILFQDKKKRRRQRTKRKNQERNAVMNELIVNFIGKRCEIHGDLGIATLVTITAVKDDWIEAEDDKGKKTLLNTAYISEIREAPEKKKKQKD